MQIFEFSWWSPNHFSAPFMGLYLPNAWSQTLQTSKRHTFRVSAFHRYHWFGAKIVSCRLCAGQSKGTLKTRKNAVLDLAPPTLQNFRTFHYSTRPRLHFDGLPPKSWPSVVGLRVRYKYYRKNIVVLVWPGAAHAPIAAKSAHKCIPYNNRCVQNFIQIGWDLAVPGPKTCFWVKTERSNQCLAVNNLSWLNCCYW